MTAHSKELAGVSDFAGHRDVPVCSSSVRWTKFLAGCFRRRVSTVVFITTGRLRGWQRDAGNEAGVVVIEGRPEVDRIAGLYGIAPFDEDEESA